MSNVTTFSRVFPADHPLAGQPTHFVEKILKSICPHADHFISKCEQCGWMGYSNCCAGGGQIADTGDYGDALCPRCFSPNLDGEIDDCHDIGYYRQQYAPKRHTIRAGKKCKAGDVFAFRVWSDKPYSSKQISVADEVKIVRVADIEIDKGFVVKIDGKFENRIGWLAANDGLTESEFRQWLKVPFSGQIRIWDDTDLPY